MKAIIDFIKWDTRPEEQLFAWKFPSVNLSTYTQLVVAESQEAILFSKGQVVGKFGPGKHTLNTENLPILRTLFGIPFGGKNPFTAEVWFINKLMPLNLDWATDSTGTLDAGQRTRLNMDQWMYEDPDFRATVPLVARGRYGFRIVDAERFLIKLVGTTTNFSARQLTDNFYGPTVTKTKSVIHQFLITNRVGIKSISAILDNLSDFLKAAIAVYWEDYGFQLHNFHVTTIGIDATNETGQEILKAIAQQSKQIIGGYTWQQSQVFELGNNAINTISNNNQGGLLNAVIATNLMGNMSGAGLLNPPAYKNQENVPNVQLPVAITREVYCSNCAKKFSSSMKFCPHCGDPYHPCPKCGADNDKSARKCISCGTLLVASEAICSNCNAALVQGAAFCTTCGKPVASLENSCKRCGYKLNNSSFCPQCGIKTGTS